MNDRESKEKTKQVTGGEGAATEPRKPDEPARDGRRYEVNQHRGKANAKLRYRETNAPSKGCRFLK